MRRLWAFVFEFFTGLAIIGAVIIGTIATVTFTHWLLTLILWTWNNT